MRIRPSHIHYRQSVARRFGVGLVLMLLAVYVLLPQASILGQSIHTIRGAYMPFVLLGVLSWLLTYVMASLTYMAITMKRLVFARTLVVQFAGGFTNRLMPAGAGALAVSAEYLIKVGYRKFEATSLTLLNNVLGAAVNLLLLVACGFWDGDGAIVRWLAHGHAILWMVGGVCALGAVLGVVWFLRRERVVKSLLRRLRRVMPRPHRLVLAMLAAGGVTLGYVGCMMFLGLALNVHVTVFEGLAVLSASVAVASVTPTPGGLGGAEAALTASLVAVGVATHQAVALALLYRLVTYWLPIIPGAIALRASKL